MQAIKQFFKTHPHAWWGAYLPVYLAMFFTIEHFITDNYWATQTVLDTYIPFCEWFIFPYVSWSPLLVALGILPILLPLGSAALVTGLVTVGLGCAPIYPSVIHETPLNFGRNLSMALTGVQMAAAYVGNVVFPPLFGLLAQYISISLYPWYLLAALVLMAVMSRALHRKTAAKRAANGY